MSESLIRKGPNTTNKIAIAEYMAVLKAKQNMRAGELLKLLWRQIWNPYR